jgi:acetyl-CoA acyltransferase 1
MASPMAQQVVVVSVSRTPLTRALRDASSAGVNPPYTASLISSVVADLLGRCTLPAEADWAAVLDDVAVGNVMAGPGGGVAARIGVAAGIRQAGIRQAAARSSPSKAAPTLDPLKVPLKMVSRQCASGLQAAVDVACSIRAGLTSCGLALGVESMSYHPMEDFGKAPHVDEEHDGLPLAKDGLPDEAYDDDPASNPEALHSSSNDAVMTPMGATSDFVAGEYGIKREEQDAFAAASHRKAAEAWEKGLFDYELCEAGSSPPPPAPTESRPYPDNGIRPSTTAASLKSLKPAFAAEGSTTAGNSSQLTDVRSFPLPRAPSHPPPPAHLPPPPPPAPPLPARAAPGCC